MPAPPGVLRLQREILTVHTDRLQPTSDAPKAHLRESCLDLYEIINTHRRVMGCRELDWNEQWYELAYLHNQSLKASGKLKKTRFKVGVKYKDIVFQVLVRDEDRQDIAEHTQLWKPAKRAMKIILRGLDEHVHDPINRIIGIDMYGNVEGFSCTVIVSIQEPFSLSLPTRGMGNYTEGEVDDQNDDGCGEEDDGCDEEADGCEDEDDLIDEEDELIDEEEELVDEGDGESDEKDDGCDEDDQLPC